MPLALRQRRPQAIIQKEGRCEEDQPSRAQRKLRVHRKCIKKRYAARERCATIPTSTPLHLATSVANTISAMLCSYAFALTSYHSISLSRELKTLVGVFDS